MNSTYFFDQLQPQHYAAAGGKGSTLARLAQAGYPVPDGLVILPPAFDGDELTPAAWEQVRDALARLQAKGAQSFAVRSSALSEDSSQASFAGEFETILDVRTDDDVRQAIGAVRRSRHSARVQAYSRAKGMDSAHELAVVVQQFVPADLAGVLFTADPLTGSRATLAGNLVHGLGEQLVSGEVNGLPFILRRPRGRYEGPPELRRFAGALYRLANRLERDLGAPQDIEWAIGGGRLLLLQSRPITTLRGHNEATGAWNDSLTGDYLWTNSNFGEAVPDVMTPCTWSLLQIYMAEAFPATLLGNYPFAGNIGGRFYMNVSLVVSVGAALGIGRKRVIREAEELFGQIPGGLEIPTIPFSTWLLITDFLPFAVRAKRRSLANRRRVPEFVARAPGLAPALHEQIGATQAPGELLGLWHDTLGPLYRQACLMLQAGTSQFEDGARSLRRDLERLVGQADANALMSSLSDGANQLASLGPLLGLAQVARGELTRVEYAERYGHRGPHEFEVSIARPAEEDGWLDQQLAGLGDSDVEALLARQRAEHAAAWERFERRYPRRAGAMRRRITAVAEAARLREAVRSEFTRMFWVARVFALRAGDLTGLGEGIFLLSIDEILAALDGDVTAAACIPARRETHTRYCALPGQQSLDVGVPQAGQLLIEPAVLLGRARD
jgi:rifampicin phosphotransferase